MVSWLNPLKNIYIEWIKDLIHKKKIRLPVNIALIALLNYQHKDYTAY